MGNLPFEKIERTVLIKNETKTDSKFGCDPYKRPIKTHLTYGVVNIDKPSGPTSHQVSAFVKQILHVPKAGHSGTLDPRVTGILAVAVGNGTRIVQALLPAGKEYVCIMHMHKEFDLEELKKVIQEEFIGKIKQLPPVKSAVKRQWRYRKVYYLDILDVKDQDVIFQIGCQAGTYIRKICTDIGKAMNMGAHMAELRRTKAGPFNEKNHMCTLQDLKDAVHYLENENDESKVRELVRPVEEAVEHLPKIWVHDTTVDTLCNGASLKIPGISKVESEIQAGELVAVMTLKNELVSMGLTEFASKDLVKKERGIAVKSSQVFMKPGVYPRIEKKA